MIVLILSLIWVGPSWAQPVANPKCAPNISLRVPKGGAGVFFDRDCKMAYVLPPANGQIVLEQIARTSNLQECSVIRNLATGRESISKAWADMARDLERSRGNEESPSNPGTPLFPAPTKPTPVNDGFDQEAWQKRLDALLESLARWTERTKPYQDMAAATAQFSYQVQHQRLVEEYQKLNPQIHFRPITLTDSRIYLARAVGTADERAIYPAVLFASIPGFAPGKANGEVGEDRGILSGEAQSGQIGFSLIGICPYYDSTSQSFPQRLTGAELAANMVANIRYVYELQVYRRYKMTYNLGAMLRRLQTTESRGGFFTTSAINRLIVERSTKEEFDIVVESDDGRWSYDETMAQTLKAQLIDRAIADLNLVSQGGPVEAAPASAPKANGADVAAKEIGKCPYLYCQVASGVLNVGSAIFGGSTTLNEYINKVDIVMTESSEERKNLSFRGTVAFLPVR